MHTIRINLKRSIDDSYDILIGNKITDLMIRELKETPFGNKYAIITDDNVKKHYGDELLKKIRKAGIDCSLISFNHGEQNKNLKIFGLLHEELLKTRIDRKSCIITLGGGIVGDIAGFVAATYMRGINYIQVPTTLLAQADSSMGGKVAIDLSSGKNSCGAFYQPKKVYIDVDFLKTLPKKEIVNGLVETVKHAVIADEKFFSLIQKNLPEIFQMKSDLLIRIAETNCSIKKNVVENDLFEKNLRKTVNYGHTIGHALETLTGYKKYTHGEAIAIGMAVEGKISNLMGWLSDKDLKSQNSLLEKIGLNLKLPEIKKEIILKELAKDKKAVSGKVFFALPEKIGKMKNIDGKYGIEVNEKIILRGIVEG